MPDLSRKRILAKPEIRKAAEDENRESDHFLQVRVKARDAGATAAEKRPDGPGLGLALDLHRSLEKTQLPGRGFPPRKEVFIEASPPEAALTEARSVMP